jgi:hypothetical protein
MCTALSDLASTSYSFNLPSIGIKDQCYTFTSKHRRFIIILVITSSVTSVGQTPSVYAHHFHFHLAPFWACPSWAPVVVCRHVQTALHGRHGFSYAVRNWQVLQLTRLPLQQPGFSFGRRAVMFQPAVLASAHLIYHFHFHAIWNIHTHSHQLGMDHALRL